VPRRLCLLWCVKLMTVVFVCVSCSYPENGVVEMSADDVRPRARTVLRFDQLQVGDVVMVNYNLENPEERGFWYDAEITSLNAVSRTNKEIHVKILLG
ncbi:hypothetical protein M9458_054409, partial [Cirrhinus mrigala]